MLLLHLNLMHVAVMPAPLPKRHRPAVPQGCPLFAAVRNHPSGQRQHPCDGDGDSAICVGTLPQITEVAVDRHE